MRYIVQAFLFVRDANGEDDRRPKKVIIQADNLQHANTIDRELRRHRFSTGPLKWESSVCVSLNVFGQGNILVPLHELDHLHKEVGMALNAFSEDSMQRSSAVAKVTGVADKD